MPIQKDHPVNNTPTIFSNGSFNSTIPQFNGSTSPKNPIDNMYVTYI